MSLATGCGGSSNGSGSAGGGTLTIYSSLPLQGGSRSQSVDILRGEQMALAQVGGKVGRLKVRLVSLDDATAQSGGWEPGQVSANARKAVQDKSAVAYLGEFNSGGCAVSIPITNQGGLLQITPDASYVGLTRADGAEAGEPAKYYPTGLRTFARIAVADHVQARAQLSYMQQQGVKRVYLLHDNGTYGKGLATNMRAVARAFGIDAVGLEGLDVKSPNFRSVAEKVARARPDAVFYGACPESAATQVFKDLHAAMPQAKLFGPDCLADSLFTKALGTAASVTYLTSGTLPPNQYPPAGREFYQRFRSRFGKDPETFGIYGYEAMSAVLDALRRAGDKATDRQSVRDAFFATRDRESVLGRYSIDKNGDTTLASYGAYRVRGGKLAFDRKLDVAAQ